jgi:hypothetical protein
MWSRDTSIRKAGCHATVYGLVDTSVGLDSSYGRRPYVSEITEIRWFKRRQSKVANVEIRQINYFRALCEELNFTRTAERCEVSQPSLTRSIQLLEKQLGGYLFHRERSSTHLSELGRVVKPHFDKIWEHALLAKQSAQSFNDLQGGRLKLGVMCTVAPRALVRLVADVCRSHPGIIRYVTGVK